MDETTIDSIFAGSLKSLPAVSSKIVRIFTSSTFTDTTMERNTLMAQCYPKLKDYCREKHGLEFQVVDMRWGVRDEATDDHMTTELCMREIENCQRLSMGPNFVVFLGQKYGYRPIPTYVLSSELEMLRTELESQGMDVSLLDKWYKKDSNAVPPTSILQPISSILKNFNNKRIPKLQQEDQAIWWDTMVKMQKLFRKGAQSLYNSGKFDKDTMHNYFMSVTEREVINGILNVKNTKNHCLAYIRYINNINLQNLRKASLFLDIVNRGLDNEASKLLANLRDERLPQKIETINLQRYTVEWIGREGLDPETHSEYLQHFITHFYRNIIKLVDRAMRKEDSSAQGQIITEILQHLHACNNSVKVFYGREDTLEKIKEHMLGDSDKPLVLYGEGGCGKTSLLAKSAGLTSSTWLIGKKPINIIRFLGTTPDSSALTPTLISICQQICYNFMLPFDEIPDDLVPLTAYFKHLLTLATTEQPILLFLDSVDQLTGVQGNKLSWLPTRLPLNCKMILSCVAEESNPVISRDYQLLRRMIDVEENFIEVVALGEDLAMEVIRMWMKTAHRDLNNYQWRLVANAITKCSLPIFVKLVFAEICRWRSYTKPADTHLTCTVMDSIMMLFERIEKQHGKILVFHALAYITAAKSGLSESELEDLISLDDKVLDDVYQYHLPPVRRIPPLLWTRIRNDLPNYLSEREADGVSVLNWYHRQFRDTAKERYFKNMNMAMYFHSMIADYYLGIWGGGRPKPFKYTEIQRHRFNLADKEGVADRKVPEQPLAFYSKEGTISRYNLRKFGELPFHLVRSRRFDDLFENVLFNYEWLHAKLSSCPLQAVLSDFEDAYNFIDNQNIVRELMLVADALRLGGAILGSHPDMLAPQLIGRLLPEIGGNVNVKMLLRACDNDGAKNCALLPVYHCLHTPGGPLKYSLEGHQFAVFGFCLTSDYRYVVSISNRFITWDLSTSDMTRDVNPGIEGIMQHLVLSPDNRYAAAFTTNNQSVVLNTLTSEFVIIDNPFPNKDPVCGIHLMNQFFFVYGKLGWYRFDLRGNLLDMHTNPEDSNKWPILSVEHTNLDEYRIVFWSGNIEDTNMLLHTYRKKRSLDPLYFHSVMVMTNNKQVLYACTCKDDYRVTKYTSDETSSQWEKVFDMPRAFNDNVEYLLQLKLDREEEMLLATSANGFIVWFLENKSDAHVLMLPNGVRNISTKMMYSNSIMISGIKNYAVAGVRKNLYVWNLETSELVKILDAHFARIIQLEALTVGNWNSVVTSSIDRSVKVWNINNIFEQVHVIDRHELQIDMISLAEECNIAAIVTRDCVGIWDLQTGRLISKLADSPLGAIVTHACITHDGKYIVSTESGNVLIWNRITEQVLFKEEQQHVRQLTLFENSSKFITVSRPKNPPGVESMKTTATLFMRTIPDGKTIFTLEYLVRSHTGTSFRNVVMTSDNSFLIVPAADKGNRDCVIIYNANTGALINKIPIRLPGFRDILCITPMPNKSYWVGIIGSDKGIILDINKKKIIRTILKWSGNISKDGKYTLYAPSRGGLELLELKKGTTIKTYIPKVAEGVFTVISMFNRTDEYVLYYHSGRKTIRVFRSTDCEMIANYRVQTELSAIDSTYDGKSIVLGTVDGCVSVLVIADPKKENMKEYVANLPSRDEDWKKKSEKQRMSIKFKAAARIARVTHDLNTVIRNTNIVETIQELDENIE
ncbi:NACHT and WD repeat domain-containing protein 2 isoform X2 [Apis mellifera]|uniref:NACHT and WD repeat domain-containing protein 2 isoform X2 n=1 Tax=Apis mellifera TaxID=7460 RepID=A0A7M7MTM9_APIME|nr:NACHT and WD repeat domain-containing protein 2 isoform X2 [Apis mellifera]|eukprot:XP_026300938.1 NACHT and WD repeat domain-containing protein 2 isoform X2 [Apis mellifera]